MEEARMVVSDKGDILSPKYAPEIMAPAIQPSSKPCAFPIPHQGDTDGSNGSPRTSGHNGNQCADDAGRCQEETGMDNLHPVVD